MATAAHVGADARRDATASGGAAIAKHGASDGTADAEVGTDDDSLRDDAEAALTQMGWKPAISRAAVTAALAGGPPTLEALIVATLQRCPRRAS